ncbi:hypothetical protein [Exiguobacterium oxidotolerans]|uniref:Uncharacterized protein n=1 Tax=Exiguobacterium oxidotolerans TaxID=223958 RepID=A0A653IGG2_9BACL|nr:hypothetical protein [Exiguobacterium oxidotolerans]VWX38237.1 conserved hypothetical protein [Exiguobacterium oxidotolerans]
MDTVEQVIFRESGQGLGQTFRLDLRTRELTVEDEEAATGTVRTTRLLTGQDIETGRRLLERTRIWKETYSSDMLILDGTDWSIELVGAEGRKTSSGSNAFPDDWDEIREWFYKYL